MGWDNKILNIQGTKSRTTVVYLGGKKNLMIREWAQWNRTVIELKVTGWAIEYLSFG